mgnify:CR=1 FL=1
MPTGFDYQSECHCSKTANLEATESFGLITSQNATAPKRPFETLELFTGLITSQNATAPKQLLHRNGSRTGLITSQNATAPKRDAYRACVPLV